MAQDGGLRTGNPGCLPTGEDVRSVGRTAGAAEAGGQGGVGRGRPRSQVKLGFSLVGNGEPWEVLEEDNNMDDIVRASCGLDYVWSDPLPLYAASPRVGCTSPSPLPQAPERGWPVTLCTRPWVHVPTRSVPGVWEPHFITAKER